jgi:hypothetical protein
MTPAQQAALAAEITNDPATHGYGAHLPDSPGIVVDLLNAQTESMVKPRMVTARTVLAECVAGAAILDKLEAAGASNSAVKWAVRFLGNDGGLDVGNAVTQTMIDQLTGPVLLAEEGAALKALAMQLASRAEVLGLGSVSLTDVMRALGMPEIA